MINIRLASKRNDFSFSPGFYFDGNAYIFAASVFNPYIHIYIYPFIHSTTIALSRVSSSLETFSAGACTRILYYTSFPRRHGGIKSASPFGGGRKKRKKKKKRNGRERKKGKRRGREKLRLITGCEAWWSLPRVADIILGGATGISLFPLSSSLFILSLSLSIAG